MGPLPRHGARRLLPLFLLLVGILHFAAANLMAVDLGEAYIKVSVARPGKGLELVANEQSKRKTPAVVGFTTEGERLFGDAAVAYAARAPERVIFNARRLLGACADGESRPAPFCTPATVSVAGIGEFSGVHAVAMLLAMARRQASAALGGAAVKDVAVTVPAWFSHPQRVAVCDAASVAGLNCLGVVNANTAAAIKYALDGKAVFPPAEKGKKEKRRDKDAEAHTVLFYDVGASAAVATVARFFRESASGPVSRIQVLSHASDTSLGGAALDEIVVAKMANAFDEQRAGTAEFKEDPRKARELPRVMARLRKEARRVREILSANTERLVAVGSLHQDRDFKTTVTRAELEEGAKDILAAAPRPVLSALHLAQVTPAQLAAVVPFGGTTRMPRIQRIVLDALGRPSMNKSINGDEAAVMGAAFFGAGLSSTFRVRKLDINDKFQRTVSAEIERDLAPAGRLSISKKQTRKAPQNVVIFDAENGHMPAKKTVSFSRVDDFEVKLHFDADKLGLSAFPQRTMYAHLKVKGVAKVLDKLGKNPGSKKGATTPTPRVALTFKMDRSGNVYIGTAESSVDETITVEREVPVKENKTKESKESPAVSPAAADSPAASAEKDSEAKSGKQEEKKEDKKKTRIEKREQSIVHRQTLTVEYLDAPGSIHSLQMTGAELNAAKKVLKALEDADNERAQRADALNGLEGFILGARSKVRGAEEGDDVYEVSTEAERESILAALDEAEDWMFSDAAGQTANLRNKHHELRKLLAGIERRAEERAARPKAVELLRSEMAKAVENVAALEKVHVERDSKHVAEFAAFGELAKGAGKWLEEQVAAQEKMPATEEPVLTVAAIEEKYSELAKEIEKLVKLELPSPKPSVAPVNGTDEKSDPKEGESIADPDAGAAKTDPNIGANIDPPPKDEL